MAMRIVYGVHGFNRGHASRTASVLPRLLERHEVLVLAGGEAYDALSSDFPTERIDTFGYSYGKTRISKLGTVLMNIPKLLDLFTIGRNMRHMIKLMREFQPDVVISDAEAYTHRAAQYLKSSAGRVRPLRHVGAFSYPHARLQPHQGLCGATGLSRPNGATAARAGF
jgi:uncharacterized protein (TIGR00661 family)